MQFILEHNNCCPGQHCWRQIPPTEPTGTGPNPFNPDFERDLLRSQISLDIETNTTVFFANYGVSDRFDVGAAIPIVSVQMAEASHPRSFAPPRTRIPGIHSFGGEDLRLDGRRDTFRHRPGRHTAAREANFVRSDANALAAAIDLRLPTGDEDDLLGTGATQTKVLFIASGEYGLFAPTPASVTRSPTATSAISRRRSRSSRAWPRRSGSSRAASI